MNDFTCRLCGMKALSSSGEHGRAGVTVVHDECLTEFKRETAAETLEMAADGPTRGGITGFALRKFRTELRDRAADLRADRETPGD